MHTLLSDSPVGLEGNVRSLAVVNAMVHRHLPRDTAFAAIVTTACKCRWWRGLSHAAPRSPTTAVESPVVSITVHPPGAAPRRQTALAQRMLVTLLTLLFYYYPSILTSTLSLFTCYHLDQNTDAVKYWDNARVGLCASYAFRRLCPLTWLHCSFVGVIQS